TLVLPTANTYTGSTTLNAGVVNISNPTALGTTAGATIINAATLQVQGIFVTGDPLTIVNTAAVLENVTGTNTRTLNIKLTTTGTVQTDSTSQLTVSGIASRTFPSPRTSALTLVLPTANTYTGATTLNAGVVTISSTAALGTTAAGTTVNAATLQIQGSIT